MGAPHLRHTSSVAKLTRPHWAHFLLLIYSSPFLDLRKRPLAFDRQRALFLIGNNLDLAVLSPQLALLIVKLKRHFRAFCFEDAIIAGLVKRRVTDEVELAMIECPLQI